MLRVELRVAGVGEAIGMTLLRLPGVLLLLGRQWPPPHIGQWPLVAPLVAPEPVASNVSYAACPPHARLDIHQYVTYTVCADVFYECVTVPRKDLKSTCELFAVAHLHCTLFLLAHQGISDASYMVLGIYIQCAILLNLTLAILNLLSPTMALLV